jgi:hypothetical protein
VRAAGVAAVVRAVVVVGVLASLSAAASASSVATAPWVAVSAFVSATAVAAVAGVWVAVAAGVAAQPRARSEKVVARAVPMRCMKGPYRSPARLAKFSRASRGARDLAHGQFRVDPCLASLHTGMM